MFVIGAVRCCSPCKTSVCWNVSVMRRNQNGHVTTSKPVWVVKGKEWINILTLEFIFSCGEGIGRISRTLQRRWSSFYCRLLSSASAVPCTTVAMSRSYVIWSASDIPRWKIDLSRFLLIGGIEKRLSELEAFQAAHPHLQPDCPEEEKQLSWEDHHRSAVFYFFCIFISANDV